MKKWEWIKIGADVFALIFGVLGFVAEHKCDEDLKDKVRAIVKETTNESKS